MESGIKAVIKSVRMVAVTGATTELGGTVTGSSGFTLNDIAAVIEGDIVLYPDGKQSLVLAETNAVFRQQESDGKSHSFASTRTVIANGDKIIAAGQNSLAIIEFVGHESGLYVLDDTEVQKLKQEGWL